MTYTQHALERLEQRGITPEMVAAAVIWGRAVRDAMPGRLYVYDRRTRRRARANGYTLPPISHRDRVGVIVKNKRVITAYWM